MKDHKNLEDEFKLFCLNCDLRMEVKSKVSWKMFILIVGGLMTILGTIITVGAPIASHGIEKMIDTSKETLTAVQNLSERTRAIEARQEIIMDEVLDHNDK